MSGIYIPGMEMPTEDEISKCIIIRHDGEVLIVEFDNLVDGGFVACYQTNPIKAIPVPDHGRLIAAFDAVKKLTDEGYYNAAEIVSDMPTIIPASTADKEGTE